MNRAVIHLQQGDELDGLQVLLETETPNLDGFEMRFDGGGWQRGEVGFHWPLKKDESLLEVRPVNGFGRKGAVSWVKVKRKG